MIPQYAPLIEPGDVDCVRKQMETTFVGCGRTVADFEAAVAASVGAAHAVATTSGTTALMLALVAAARSDRPRRVLFPAYTFLAGANAARLLGFEVELVDIDPETLCLSPALVAESLARREAAAVIYVDHNAYVGPQRDEVRALCDRYGTPMIEDSAQCIGVLKRLAGSVGIFSFSVPKLVTTGQGGCVITESDELAQAVRDWADHGGGWRESRLHRRIGGNFRFNDILAAYGLSQLERLDRLLRLRKSLFDRYRLRIAIVDHGMDSAWMVIRRTHNAAALAESLRTRGIQAVQYYRPIHHNPAYLSTGQFPAAERAYRELLYLPSSLGLRPDEIDAICDAVLSAECDHSRPCS